MGKINVYLPDELEQQVKAANISVSPVCQQALQQELQRQARASELQAGMSRIEFVDDDIPKAFTGTQIAMDLDHDTDVFLTKNGRIAVLDHGRSKMFVYDEFSDFAKDCTDNDELVQSVANALGNNHFVELDI
ncbi:type II toxin-antitoxin system CcdA family antitoxin [Amycolatopsis pithecellobii]|uniref:Uncharacterized protein n=1 Tax=Amycolatopsis pithecellobii TaxID=664692 RepID=A0A6N7Z3J8_9PSEU|nr:type II toxin-antitoxin system CcdA family antitoxin [Amycolatopsis pithecellobii]MTD55719.1 hypothetical protein [Amycolatopsis pithecellobii]